MTVIPVKCTHRQKAISYQLLEAIRDALKNIPPSDGSGITANPPAPK